MGVSSSHPSPDRTCLRVPARVRRDPRHRPPQPDVRGDRRHPDVAIRDPLATHQRRRVDSAQSQSRLVHRHTGHLQPGRVRGPDHPCQGPRVRAHRRGRLPLRRGRVAEARRRHGVRRPDAGARAEPARLRHRRRPDRAPLGRCLLRQQHVPAVAAIAADEDARRPDAPQHARGPAQQLGHPCRRCPGSCRRLSPRRCRAGPHRPRVPRIPRRPLGLRRVLVRRARLAMQSRGAGRHQPGRLLAVRHRAGRRPRRHAPRRRPPVAACGDGLSMGGHAGGGPPGRAAPGPGL